MLVRFLGALAILTICAGNATAQNVNVRGTTTVFIDRQNSVLLPPEKTVYEPLPHASIAAFRRQQLERVTSDSSGKYELRKLSPGQPIALFYDGGSDLVPELWQLAADLPRRQEIHVTLLTHCQYMDIYGREALVHHLRRIIAKLERMEGFQTDELRNRFRRQFDVSFEQ